MTEAEWLAATDSVAMLAHLRGDVPPADVEADLLPCLFGNGTKLIWGDAAETTPRRLEQVALQIGQGWHRLPLDDASRNHLSEFEDFLSGRVTPDEYQKAAASFWNARPTNPGRALTGMTFHWGPTPFGVGHLARDLAGAWAYYKNRDRIEELSRSASDDDLEAWSFFGYDFPEFIEAAAAIWKPIPNLLRDVIGNPFRHVSLNPAWLTSAVVALAAAIYAGRAFDRLPVLADALEEAGCDHPDVLAHCRGDGPHARGCWVVDMVLGKA